MLGGVHPNCESMTLLVSDGRRYCSANKVLKMPLRRVAEEILARGRKIDARLSRLDPKKRVDRLRGQLLVLKTYLPLVLRAVSLKLLFKGQPLRNAFRILGGLLAGKPLRDLLHQYANAFRVLRVAVLPFEEYHSIDAARLENCKAVFVYEDVEDGRLKTIPACTWYLYRNEYLRKIAAKWGKAPATTDSPAAQAETGEPASASPAGAHLPVPKKPSAALTAGTRVSRRGAQQPGRSC